MGELPKARKKQGKLIKIEIGGRKTCPLLPNARTTIEAETTSKSEISKSANLKSACQKVFLRI